MSDSKDFVIKDRRVFSQDTPEEKEDSRDSSETGQTEEKAESQETEDLGASGGTQESAPLPEINFSTFIMSLNASALVNLGVIDDPASGTKSRNLPLGKQTIDILGMLEDKTQGNLTEDEAEMLKSVLYELRILYVKEKG